MIGVPVPVMVGDPVQLLAATHTPITQMNLSRNLEGKMIFRPLNPNPS